MISHFLWAKIDLVLRTGFQGSDPTDIAFLPERLLAAAHAAAALRGLACPSHANREAIRHAGAQFCARFERPRKHTGFFLDCHSTAVFFYS